MNMFSYTPTQMYSMQQPRFPVQQGMYVPQQTGANLIYDQYNQLHSMQTAFSTPSLVSMGYTQQPMTQAQQIYRTDQLVPQTTSQISAPLQQVSSSNPINIHPISSSDIWMASNSLQKSPDTLRSIPHAVSRHILNIPRYDNRAGSTTMLPMSASYEMPTSALYRANPQPLSSSDDYLVQRRSSMISSFESDFADVSSDDDDDFGWRLSKVNQTQKTLTSSNTRLRSDSMGRSEATPMEQHSNDIYQQTGTTNGALPATNSTSHSTNKNNNHINRPKLIEYIENNIVGRNQRFMGPWGWRQMFYCDYTASSRPLDFIENYIRTHVLPLYGNTHSETSLVAQQSTKFREEARAIIKKVVHADENDILLFTGTGSTGAVHALVDNFNFHEEKTRKNTVVMVSAFEHHSNILPWTEAGVEVIRIPTTQQGLLDKSALQNKLQEYATLRKRILCSFNAASNISGIYTDVDSVSTIVHSFGGLVFWDYATAAPYVKIDMNPSPTAYKDAIFISTHKLLGGPSTPGILVVKKALFSLKPPKACGGGTVNFVTRTCREYNYDFEIREEGGTPDIIGCIRAGLVFQLKDAIDHNYIKAREDELVKRFFRRFKKTETLVLLGPQNLPRFPIFAFAIYVPSVCKYLHHNFVCMLFNDLFGIQVRSGCVCAGPYALDLLNIDDSKTDTYCLFMTEDACARGNDGIVRTMMMKPGFTRLNLPYFANDNEIEYVLNAVDFIANHGWKFLPLYTYNPVTAAWSPRSGFRLAQSSLEDITYKAGKMQQHSGKKHGTSSAHMEKPLPDVFREAKLLATDAVRYALEVVDYTSDPPLNVPDKYVHMVWFALPIDIALVLFKQKETGQPIFCDVNSIPFMPDDAKKRITDSMKSKTLTNGRSASHNRKKHEVKRDASSTYLH